MITQTLDFVTKFIASHEIPKRVLEVGSRHVSGVNFDQLRDKIPAEEYIGIDLFPGIGVDRVMDSHDIKKVFSAESFDLVITSDALEHDSKFWVTVENMRWALKPGGWMIIAVPTLHCGLHEWPKDYWRFIAEGVGEFFEGFEDCYLETFTIGGGDLAYPDELMAWGRKK